MQEKQHFYRLVILSWLDLAQILHLHLSALNDSVDVPLIDIQEPATIEPDATQ
jgi:hypothetical protein